MNPLAKVLDDALRRMEGSVGLEARAVMLWPELVGPKIAGVTEAQSVADGTLVVLVRDAAWNTEVTFLKPELLGRYEKRLGKRFICDIRTRVGRVRGAGPSPHAAPAPPTEEVRRIRLPAAEAERIREASETGDPELAQAIRRALTREAQARQWHLEHGARPCSRCGAAHRAPHELCPACRQDRRTEAALRKREAE